MFPCQQAHEVAAVVILGDSPCGHPSSAVLPVMIEVFVPAKVSGSSVSVLSSLRLQSRTTTAATNWSPRKWNLSPQDVKLNEEQQQQQ